MKTTLNAIRKHDPCRDGWQKLLAYLGKTKPDDEPLSILTILDSNGLDDALWCLRAVEGHARDIRLFAVWCARQIQHLMTDPRSLQVLDVAEAYAHGQATKAELDAARDAAWAARDATPDAPWDAAWDTTWAAVKVAAREVTCGPVGAVAWIVAGRVAVTIGDAGTAARDAARAAQAARLRKICGETP